MIITLCGSTRFIESFHFYNKHLTLAGQVIFSVATSVKGDWQPTPDEKKVLDLIHLAKIDASDAIFVIDREYGKKGDPTSYLGASTLNEIRWAALKGKKVFYASKHDARDLVFGCLTISRHEFAKGFNTDDWTS